MVILNKRGLKMDLAIAAIVFGTVLVFFSKDVLK